MTREIKGKNSKGKREGKNWRLRKRG